MDINYKQFIFAREYRGLSQTALAKNIKGLSQSNLSKFEKGLGTLSNEVIDRIIEHLEFPRGFYEKRIYNVVENAHYRTKSITKGNRMELEYSSKIIGYIIDEMSDAVEFPDTKIKQIDIEDGYTPFEIASFTRRFMGLTDEPVKDIFTLLENYGIIVVEIEDSTDLFDGVSFPTDKGYYVVVINKNFSNDRKRFTLAHELGHIIMHISPTFIIPNYRDKEAEAHQFASEFLMPSDHIRSSLRSLKLSSLGELKRYWLTSMASIIRRAYDLELITKEKYSNFYIELSRRGYRKNEPINVYIDKPTLFNQAYLLHKNELNYSDSDLAESFGLSIDIIDKFFHTDTPKVKMRVIRRNA